MGIPPSRGRQASNWGFQDNSDFPELQRNSSLWRNFSLRLATGYSSDSAPVGPKNSPPRLVGSVFFWQSQRGDGSKGKATRSGKTEDSGRLSSTQGADGWAQNSSEVPMQFHCTVSPHLQGIPQPQAQPTTD